MVSDYAATLAVLSEVERRTRSANHALTVGT
jgi:hypothetical protein